MRYDICKDCISGLGEVRWCTIPKNEQDSSFLDPDGDSGSWILDPNFSIPDPGSASKNLGILNPRNFSKLSESGSGMCGS